jgi:hypothetical protein
MFQLIGGLLAFFAVISVAAGSPIAGIVFALTTFVWAVAAKPNRRVRPVKEDALWDAIHEARR